MVRSLTAAALLVVAASFLPLPVAAQGGDFFIPGQPQRPAQGQPQRPAQARPLQRSPVQVAPQPPPATPDEQQQQLQVALPPVPEIPVLPRGATPPAAVIGVLGVPEVMRASTAAQQVEKTIGERRERLNEDAQKEQAAWRELQQALGGDRGKLSPEQIRQKERELQDRITKAQREFRERGNIVQQATQYGLAQIERTLVGVIQRVAEARGMNLVLHRQQVALNVNEFDITEQVAEQLNKVLPSVIMPPDGVSPVAMQPKQPAGAQPVAAPGAPVAAAPVAGPPVAGPAAQPAPKK